MRGRPLLLFNLNPRTGPAPFLPTRAPSSAHRPSGRQQCHRPVGQTHPDTRARSHRLSRMIKVTPLSRKQSKPRHFPSPFSFAQMVFFQRDISPGHPAELKFAVEPLNYLSVASTQPSCAQGRPHLRAHVCRLPRAGTAQGSAFATGGEKSNRKQIIPKCIHRDTATQTNTGMHKLGNKQGDGEEKQQPKCSSFI